MVIVSSHYNEDLKWLEKSEWPVIVYSKNPDSVNYRGQKNVGRESTAYLKYIIDNYYNLPDHVAFIHGHESAWHQEKDLFDLIRRAKIDEYEFISLNFYYMDRGINEHERGKLSLIKDRWDVEFKPFLNIDCPTTIKYDCCAQFIVSRRRILNNSLGAYEHWYSLIMDEDDNITAFVFELLWHVIFGEEETEDENLLQIKFK